ARAGDASARGGRARSDASLRYLQHGRHAGGVARGAGRARRLLAAVAARLSGPPRPGTARAGGAFRRRGGALRAPAVALSPPLPPLHRSRGIVMRLSGLFALDSFAGGFVPQTFIAYLFVRKYDASPQTLAITFFAIGILQALSFQAAVRIAGRTGLLRTMVFT